MWWAREYLRRSGPRQRPQPDPIPLSLKEDPMRQLLLATLTVVALCSTAFAQLTAETIQRSRWNTNYEALGGGRVQALLTFNGTQGIYETNDGQGTLNGVRYDVRLGGGATITGNWSFGDTNGRFTFFVAGNSQPPAFSGSWQANGMSGNWSGRFSGIAQQGGGGGGQVNYGPWMRTGKGNYYRKCTFPQGGQQLLILFPSKPQWVYWYNQEKQVYWCCCPTIKHPDYGDDVQAGKDLFLMATRKTNDIETCEFPEDAGPNFRSGATAKDRDGSDVDLGCPPPELPPGV